ncbi:MAG: PEGA domain-containing protein [Vicinamibacterales bacterium]
MKPNAMLIPIGAMTLMLGAAGVSAEEAQGRHHRDRGRRESQGEARERSGGGEARERSGGGESRQRDSERGRREEQSARTYRPERPSDGRREGRGDGDRRADVRRDDRGPSRWDHDRDRDVRRYDLDRFRGPRYVPYRYYRPARRHYYGPGGNFSVYFGWGSGYRYGSPYAGRVYGYIAPSSGYYGARRYYGDVRLLVRPREAAVYVDGYYAGVVDDFDGIFQRLTIESGPHQIEIDAPGFESQVFDVYVDPTRTIELRADLFPERP